MVAPGGVLVDRAGVVVLRGDSDLSAAWPPGLPEPAQLVTVAATATAATARAHHRAFVMP